MAVPYQLISETAGATGLFNVGIGPVWCSTEL